MNKYFQDQLELYSNAFQSLKTLAVDKLKAVKSSRNREIELYVTPLEAKIGAKKDLVLTREHGRSERIVVSVPAGIRDGNKLRLKGKGMPSFLWIPPGDILLKVQIINDK